MMRLLLTTIIMTMLAQQVWADEGPVFGDWRPVPVYLCHHAIIEGVIVWTKHEDNQSTTMTLIEGDPPSVHTNKFVTTPTWQACYMFIPITTCPFTVGTFYVDQE